MYAKAAAEAIQKHNFTQDGTEGPAKLQALLDMYRNQITPRQVRKARAGKGSLPQPLRAFVARFGR